MGMPLGESQGSRQGGAPPPSSNSLGWTHTPHTTRSFCHRTSQAEFSGRAPRTDTPPITADAAAALAQSLCFEVSPHTRRIHVYSSPTQPLGVSFSARELQAEWEGAPGEPPGPEDPTLQGIVGGLRHEEAVIRWTAARFRAAWERQPLHSRPLGLPCTLAGLPLQCDALREALREARQGSTRRLAPRLQPSASEQAALPDAAVYIPAEVIEARLGARVEVQLHWQPFVPAPATDTMAGPGPGPGPGAGAGAQGTVAEGTVTEGAVDGVLLCVNPECLAPLGMGTSTVQRGPTQHDLPSALPDRARLTCRVEHASHHGLVCGGACWRAYRLARDPAAVRRDLRKLHLRLDGAVFCQHCGVDCLQLAVQLQGLADASARRALLLARLPHLAQWPGKLERAVRDGNEGAVWEADHVTEVREGGGEARSLREYEPLCVACHQAKTNATGAALRDQQDRRARGFAERRPAAAEPGAEGVAGEGGTPGARPGGGRKRKRSTSALAGAEPAQDARAPAASASLLPLASTTSLLTPPTASVLPAATATTSPLSLLPVAPGSVLQPPTAAPPSPLSSPATTTTWSLLSPPRPSPTASSLLSPPRPSPTASSLLSSSPAAAAPSLLPLPAAVEGPGRGFTREFSPETIEVLDSEEDEDRDGDEAEESLLDESGRAVAAIPRRSDAIVVDGDEDVEEGEGEAPSAAVGPRASGSSASDLHAFLADARAELFSARAHSRAAPPHVARTAASAFRAVPPAATLGHWAPPAAAPSAATVELPGPRAVWEVELSGWYTAYGPEEQVRLEAAYRAGAAAAQLSLPQGEYEVSLHGEKRQRLCADLTRSRRVRRREIP